MRGNAGQVGGALDLHDKAQAFVQALGVRVAGGNIQRRRLKARTTALLQEKINQLAADALPGKGAADAQMGEIEGALGRRQDDALQLQAGNGF